MLCFQRLNQIALGQGFDMEKGRNMDFDFKQKILKKRAATFKVGAHRYYIETKLHTLRICRQHTHVNVSVYVAT